MDEFQEKRNMVKMLLDMLKGSAADEVANHMKAPEGMPDHAKGLEIEKVSVVPGDTDKGEPLSPESEALADKVMPKGDTIAEEKERAPEMAEEDDEEQAEPAFSSFMKRKGKK